MKYPHAKKALVLLIVCFFLGLVGSLVGGILDVAITEGVAGTIVTLAVTAIVGIMTIVAYGIGGKDNKNFKTAFVVELISVIVTLVGAILSVVGNGATWSTIIYKVLTIIGDALGIAIFYYVCKACGEVTDAPAIKHFAKVAYTWYTVAVCIVLVAAIVAIIGAAVASEVVATVAVVISVIGVIADLVAEILQLILIFKANKHCK